MANPYYTHGSYPATGSAGSSASLRAELDAISAGFALLPTLAGNGGLVIAVNPGGTALVAQSTLDGIVIGGTTPAAATFTNVTVNGTVNGTTIPTSKTLVDTNSAQTLTNKALTQPTISQIVNTGTLTLPTSTDTLVGRATTDTLTNKTLLATGTNTVEATSGPSSSAFTLRNKTINGSMVIAQRPATAISASTLQYGQVDRFCCYNFGFTTISGLLVQGGATGNPASSSGFSCQQTITTTGTGSIQFRHRYESNNVANLNSKTITFSCKVGLATSQTVSITINKANSQDNFSATTTLGSTTTGAMTGGTVSYSLALGSSDASNGLEVIVQFNNIGAVTSQQYYVADWQLEQGPVVTPFESRPIGLEWTLCQRYWQQLLWSVSFNATGVQDVYAYVNYPVPMRASPSLTRTSGSFTNSSLPGAGSAGVYYMSDLARSAAAGASLTTYVAQLSAEL